MKKQIKQLLLAVSAFSLISQSAEARWFSLNNGNLEGAIDVLKSNFPEGPMNYTYSDGRLFNPLSFGFRLEAIRTSNLQGKGQALRTKKQFNGGWMVTRSYTGDWDRDRAWSAFWNWNDVRCGTKLEIDLIEYTPFSSQFNAYYCRQDGTKINNARGWRDSWARWGCSWAKNATGANCSYNNVKKFAGLKGRTRNVNVKIRYTNRPWAFDGNANGGWKRFGNMYVDFLEYQGS